MPNSSIESVPRFLSQMALYRMAENRTSWLLTALVQLICRQVENQSFESTLLAIHLGLSRQNGRLETAVFVRSWRSLQPTLT